MFLMRRAGYGFERKNPTRAKTLLAGGCGADQYPKFHVYAHKEGDTLFVNLHLDQKKPTYAGVTAHSGEYDGEIVEQEAERIKALIDKTNKEIEGQIAAKTKPSIFKRIF